MLTDFQNYFTDRFRPKTKQIIIKLFITSKKCRYINLGKLFVHFWVIFHIYCFFLITFL